MHYSPMKQKDNWQGEERLREIEYFQSFYPESMRTLRVYVAAECDKMDYPDSPMYDAYPDQQMILQACHNICKSIPNEVGNCLTQAEPLPRQGYGYESTDVEEVEIYEILQGQQMNRRRPGGPPPWGPPSGPPHWGPPSGPPSRPHPGRNNWLDDVIRVLLLDEMQRRRCGNRRCF